VAVDLALHLHVIFLDDKKVTKFFFYHVQAKSGTNTTAFG
jgi:hypothetical protein